MRLHLGAAAIAATVAFCPAARADTALNWETQCHQAWTNRNAGPVNAAMVGACMGCTAGVADGLRAAGELCAPPNVEIRQIQIMVRKYIDQHPEQLNDSMSDIIKRTLVPVWPCSRLERARRHLQEYEGH